MFNSDQFTYQFTYQEWKPKENHVKNDRFTDQTYAKHCCSCVVSLCSLLLPINLHTCNFSINQTPAVYTARLYTSDHSVCQCCTNIIAKPWFPCGFLNCWVASPSQIQLLNAPLFPLKINISWHFGSSERTLNDGGFPVHILQTGLTGRILAIT